MDELLRWLDVIPGRNWLILGPGAAELAKLVCESSQPTGVTVTEQMSALATSTFDVGITLGMPVMPALVEDLRRVIWPAGIVAAYVAAEAAGLEQTFRAAGLHAVQSCGLGGLVAIRGAR